MPIRPGELTILAPLGQHRESTCADKFSYYGHYWLPPFG
jgi:hypothetical protein